MQKGWLSDVDASLFELAMLVLKKHDEEYENSWEKKQWSWRECVFV